MVKYKNKKVITRNSEKLLVWKNERITATYANFPTSQKLKNQKILRLLEYGIRNVGIYKLYYFGDSSY